MNTRSMTGYARARRFFGTSELVLSLKSVNHRSLDIHFHLPSVLDPFELIARNTLKLRIARGHVQVHVAIATAPGEVTGSLDMRLLKRWEAAFRQAADTLGSEIKPNPHEALRFPGMLTANAELEWSTELEQALTACLNEAVKEFDEFRVREGEAIAEEMRGRVQEVEEAASRMSQIRSNATRLFQERLQGKLRELLAGSAVEPQRLVQEAAILADRSDVSEEIMRLSTHAAQIRTLLASPGEKGKKLDFLLQEMNRESNTILSKTSGLGDYGLTLTELALHAKAEIDKMREQTLNLE